MKKRKTRPKHDLDKIKAEAVMDRLLILKPWREELLSLGYQLTISTNSDGTFECDAVVTLRRIGHKPI